VTLGQRKTGEEEVEKTSFFLLEKRNSPPILVILGPKTRISAALHLFPVSVPCPSVLFSFFFY
jgi:hypothetical protein